MDHHKYGRYLYHKNIFYTMTISYKRNLYGIIVLCAITLLGFYSKMYSGPGFGWVNNSLSGILYELFWCLLFFLLRPRTRTFHIVITVFIVTCALECMQLWHPPVLEFVRKSFIGRTLIGTTFVWSDFFYYLVGCSLGYFGLINLRKIE
jgi:hypothetical protein